mgnify:CR=1 FL=1
MEGPGLAPGVCRKKVEGALGLPRQIGIICSHAGQSVGLGKEVTLSAQQAAACRRPTAGQPQGWLSCPRPNMQVCGYKVAMQEGGAEAQNSP